MEFRILGPLEATNGDEPVPLGGRKQRALIARLLLDANRTVAVDRLVDDLWGEDVPETAAKMVQIAVSRLRKVLPDGVLVTRSPGYALEIPPEALDLERFNGLRREARAALAAEDAAAAARLGREALALWRGPALEEFPEPFAEAEGAHLEELRLTCLADRIEADLALGHHADCVAELEALVGRHPLRERLRSQQMLALYRSGRQAEALDAFQRFRRKLDEELGLVPSAELSELNDRMIRQDPDLGGPADEVAPVEEPTEPAAPAEETEEAPPAAVTERRHLTIVACTLADDALSGLDPEEAHRHVVAFQRAAAEAVEELGGHPAQQLGSTFVAYFGWPRAYEDGPLRAVRTALRVARETGARVGVDSGLAVVGGEGFGAVGHTATQVLPLAERARDGSVLVGEATEALVRGWVDARPTGDGAFSVTGETGIRSSLELAHARGLTPFVGREPEFHLLHQRWRRAASGSGQVVFVSGEPGVGKSRIVDALARRIESDRPARLTFRCQSEGGASALQPVHGALGPAMPHDEDPERLRTKIADLILRRAQEAPLLAVFEDLHWADASTLELLALLIRRAPSASVLLLATFRHDFRPRPELLGHVTQLTLARLDRDETEEMIQALVGDKDAPPELIERIAERTDGIPLFIEEAVRQVEEGGSLTEDVPATLQDSLMARLDRLGDAREVAQTAALLAREFPFELLQAVMPDDEQRLRAALDRLVEAGILYDAGHDGRYLFKHVLLQEAAYDSLLHSTRQELHVKVAEVLEQRFEALVEVEPECVARHLTRAGRTLDALPHWLRAGERSLAASAYPEAMSHLETGLRLLPELADEQQRAVLELKFLQRLGTARMGAAGYGAPENEATFARAEELSRTLDDSAQLAPALFGLTTYYMGTAQEARGYPIALRLRRIGEAAGADPIVTGAEALLGGCAFLLGRLEAARAHLDGALRVWDPAAHRELAVRFGREPGIIALNMRALVLGWLGEVVPARRSAEAAITAARDVGHPIALSFALGSVAVLEQGLGDVDRVAAIGREMIAIAGEHRLPIWLAWGRTFDGWARLRGGDPEGGLEQAMRGLDMARAAGFRTTSPHLVAGLADACVRAGIPEAIAGAVDDVLPLVEPERERLYAPELYRVRAAALLVESPSSPEAEQGLRDALALARSLHAPLPELTSARTLAELLHARGEHAEAHDLLTAALAPFGEDRSAPVVAEAAATLDGLAQRVG